MASDSPEFPRRNLLKGVLGTGLAGAIGVDLATARAADDAPKAGAIPAENARAGAADWQLTYTRVDPKTKYRCPWIEGYVSRASAKAGEKLEFFISTNPPAPLVIDIYRMGYYAGRGARHMTRLGPFQGKTQADPPVGDERLRECQWEATTSLAIPADWPSGVYLGKLSLVPPAQGTQPPGIDRLQSYVVFVVKDERKADILFQVSDNTWQAYNRWPDNFSLYDDGKTPWNLIPGVKVSFDRPYGKYCQIFDAPLSQGSGEFLLWEFPLAYWLEQRGYDVTYCSNTDIHADAPAAARGKVFISVGHDEYWSLEQFEHVKQAIAGGVNALFLSGNSVCFVSPFSAGTRGTANRVLTRAGRYGGVSEAERGKMGPFPLTGPNENTLMGARTISPFNGAGDWVVSDEASWIFAGTGMKRGDKIPGLVGWEFHGDPAKIPGLTVVAEGDTINGSGQSAHWTATLYPGPKGNWVFNASTIFWAQGLSSPPGHMLPYAHFGRPHGVDDRVQKITENLLKRMLAGAG